jgi:hypothetical protein
VPPSWNGQILGTRYRCRNPFTCKRRACESPGVRLESKAEQFRENAANCLKLAAAAHDEQARAMFVRMAETWVRLADSQEEARDQHGSEEH